MSLCFVSIKQDRSESTTYFNGVANSVNIDLQQIILE